MMSRWLVIILSARLLAPIARAAPLPLLAPEEVLRRMEQRNDERFDALRSYQARRRYQAEHPILKRPAHLLVAEDYRAPEERTFRVLERSGPATMERHLFSRLLVVEVETARGAVRRQVDLCRRNYRFTYQRYDAAAGAYIFQVEPRTSNPYLLRGKVWVNAEDFAVQRIEGEPAQSHSFWVRESRFVHEFARFGDFWFPVRHQSEAELRLLGRATLEIVYFDYRWQARQQGGL